MTTTGADHVPAREQCGPRTVPEHHNRRRHLTWPEIMAEPLTWDEWRRCREQETDGREETP